MKPNFSCFFLLVKGHKVTTLLCLCMSALPSLGTAGPLKQIPLDNYVIQSVPVATVKGNTVIMFPAAIQALYASRCALQEQPNADFLLDFQAGQYWFTLRALKKDVEDYITVIYERKAYVLHVTSSDKPLYTVSFFRGEGTGGLSARRVTPARLLSLIDKAKAYKLFLAQEPDADGVYIRVPAGKQFYLYVTQTIDLTKSTRGGSKITSTQEAALNEKQNPIR
jgi:hypothetical protein